MSKPQPEPHRIRPLGHTLLGQNVTAARQIGLAGLGRRIAPDPRDADFPMQPKAAKRNQRARSHYVRGVLDQGATPQCVAYSGMKWLDAHPIVNKPPFSPAQLYVQCQRIDEWAGTPHEGTSCRALFKVLKGLGYISEYRWATDISAIVNHILTTGPVEAGTDFYENMANPDAHDFMEPSGDFLGGHAYVLLGVDLDKKCPDGSKGALRILNSWGYNWSDNGRAWIGLKAFEKLLAAQGEAGIGLELKGKQHA